MVHIYIVEKPGFIYMTLEFRLLFIPHQGNLLVTIAGRQTHRHTISTVLRILKNKKIWIREKRSNIDRKELAKNVLEKNIWINVKTKDRKHTPHVLYIHQQVMFTMQCKACKFFFFFFFLHIFRDTIYFLYKKGAFDFLHNMCLLKVLFTLYQLQCGKCFCDSMQSDMLNVCLQVHFIKKGHFYSRGGTFNYFFKSVWRYTVYNGIAILFSIKALEWKQYF